MINRQENLYKHYLKIKCLLHTKLYILEGMLTKQITFLTITINNQLLFFGKTKSNYFNFPEIIFFV
jgi:hypothetical protein